jgi:hypothetical protein
MHNLESHSSYAKCIFVRSEDVVVQGLKYSIFSTVAEVEEVQSPLNQKLSSKSLRAIDFASRFVLLIKSKFKIHTFNSYYESRYKINDS